MLKSYVAGRHEGNFIDLLPTLSKYVFMEKKNFSKTVRELLRIDFVNVFKMFGAVKKIGELKKSDAYNRELDMYIDNRDLDGVTETFMKKDCVNRSCAGCGYCEELVKKSVKITAAPEQYGKDLKVLNSIVDDLVSGEFFS